jgi:outer membrane lipoprotein-sorting protein
MNKTFSKAMTSAVLACAMLFSAAASAEEYPQPNLADISGWFNGIKTMEARFQQYNNDGTIDAGTLYIMRPGRLRMDYDSQEALVLVSGGSIALYDGARDKHAERYPLRATPLWHLLRRDVDLGRPGAIKAYDSHKDLTRITAYDEDRPEAGRMVLEFDNSDGTIKLDGWKVRTAHGETVNVRLRDAEYGIPLSDLLFSIRAEERRRNPHNDR